MFLKLKWLENTGIKDADSEFLIPIVNVVLGLMINDIKIFSLVVEAVFAALKFDRAFSEAEQNVSRFQSPQLTGTP